MPQALAVSRWVRGPRRRMITLASRSVRQVSTHRRMVVPNINLENFDQQGAQASSPVLVDFWAAWCGPCSMLSPVVEELAQEHPEIAFGKVNVDEVPELAQRYQISAIPTLLLFRDGKPVDMSVGVKSKRELEAFLK